MLKLAGIQLFLQRAFRFSGMCTLLFALHSNIYAEAPLIIQSNKSDYSLGAYLSYIEDARGELSIEDVLTLRELGDGRVQAHYEDLVNLGVSDSAFWFFATLHFHDDSTSNKEWFLEIGYPLLRSLDLYVFSDGKLLSHQKIPLSHDNNGAEVRGHQQRHFLFDLNSQSHHELKLVLRVESFARMFVPMELRRADVLVRNSQWIEYSLGFYFGLMVVMVLYQGVIYLVIRDRSYLYYVAYIVSVITFFLVLSGLGQQYFWFYSPYLNERLPLTSAHLAMAFSLKFALAFLSLEKISRKLSFMVNALAWLFVAAALVALVYPFEMTIFSAFTSLLFAFVLLFVILYARTQGSKEANILLLSFSVLMISILVFVASLLAWIPVNDFTINSIYFGTAIQVLLLSLALANQINNERKERYLALIREHQAVQNLHRLEEESLERAMLDPLTGLPNRAALELFSDNLYNQSADKANGLVVCLIYLQGYQEINHTLGFRSSDLLLERVAKRINRLAGEFEDCLAIKSTANQKYYAMRIDSLSFAVFFTFKESKEKYLGEIQHLLGLLNRPIEIHDMFLDIQARAGVAFAPEHSTNIFTLLRFAQAAVETKNDATATLALYSSIVSQLAARRLKLVSGLRRAILADELSLVFQAQLDIRAKKIVGMEALCRWQHPEYGNIEPSEFVLLAEKTGLIDDLSTWVIKESLESLAWFYQRSLKLRLSINISAKNLSNHDFVKNLQSQIEFFNLPMKAITLEITETSLMQDPENAIHILNEVHKKGIAVAIDDFGSGYSSLAYIKQLPISELKIDRSFVSQIDSFHSDRVITKSTIAMAHEMGARVCAEGVENASCLKILAQFDCDIAQGFHIAKPLSKEEFVVWMDESQIMT